MGVLSGIKITKEFANAFQAIETTSDNYFITGNAGTGKSTFIDHIRTKSKKNIVVLAPTGLAANNIRGQTIHSFFSFPPKLMSADILKTLRPKNRDLFSDLDTIIIDEASMLRADMLDAINHTLQKVGPRPNQPFGGVQMVLVGDLFQLPPVVTRDEHYIMTSLYETPFFFSSTAFKGYFGTINFTKIFRQKDKEFITVLNTIRTGQAGFSDIDFINKTAQTGKSNKAVTITTVNAIADSINKKAIDEINAPSYTFSAFLSGQFEGNERNLPAPMTLELKKGARVMFIKNGRLWVNGSLGEITDIDSQNIKVLLDENNEEVDVTREEWQHINYTLNQSSGEIEEDIVWSQNQFPLRPAYAITIHKSQGMTFDQVNIDYTRSPFAHGQTYVALSRSKSLSGIYLTKPLSMRDIIIDERIIEFHKTFL